MSGIIKDIKLSSSNSLNGYFPVRTNNNDDAFDWDVAQAFLIRGLYLTDIKVKSFTEFKDQCQRDFESKLDDTGLWAYIERMYLNDDEYFKISPEFLLFHLVDITANSAKKRLGDLFISLLQNSNVGKQQDINRNFLEQQVVTSLSETLIEYKGKEGFQGNHEEPYLPFLSQIFQKDVHFLAERPKYMVATLKDLLKLYGYLYTAQMALNLTGLTSEPCSKPLYFIMESETASQERVDLKKHGHQKVAPLLNNIFPYLTMSECLQNINISTGERRKPLWKLAQELTDEDTPKLIKYAEDFAKDRFESEEYVFPEGKKGDVVDCLRELLGLAVKQFDRGRSRSSAQGKFIRATEVELCSNFVRSRGKTGKVLVINQDYLMLLTNVAIGSKDKLRFHELLDEFKARGVYFDKKTQLCLIQFYERVGNVERMSDSGDAVYVRKTV